MIRNNSGGGLINENSVAERTLTASHLSVFLRQNEKRKTCKISIEHARTLLSHSNASFRRNGTSFVDADVLARTRRPRRNKHGNNIADHFNPADCWCIADVAV
jgi:hypothetical protein